MWYILASGKIASWYTQASSDSSFNTTTGKVIKLSGYALSIAKVCAGCGALIGAALGLLLLAIGSRKTAEKGKENMIHSAIALILISVILGVVTAILEIVGQ